MVLTKNGLNGWGFFEVFFKSYDFYACLGNSHSLKTSPDVRETGRKDAASCVPERRLGVEAGVDWEKMEMGRYFTQIVLSGELHADQQLGFKTSPRYYNYQPSKS